MGSANPDPAAVLTGRDTSLAYAARVASPEDLRAVRTLIDETNHYTPSMVAELVPAERYGTLCGTALLAQHQFEGWVMAAAGCARVPPPLDADRRAAFFDAAAELKQYRVRAGLDVPPN